MKILYVTTGLGRGGAEKVVCDLADKMIDLGHEVKIAYLTGEIFARPTKPEIEILALNLNSTRDFTAASKKYRKLIKAFRPDVVHAHMVHANLFIRLNRMVCRVPKIVCTAHSSNEGGAIRMLAYKMTNFLSDTNTHVSQEAKDIFVAKRAFTENNLITIYNGIDIQRYKKSTDRTKADEDVLNIIAVGRFYDPKDYPNLIHAYALLIKNTHQKTKLTIVGEGELRPQIEQLIQELNLNDSIELLGHRTDIPQLLSQSDVFVLASKFEGLPTVVIEAMACECYVVATDCGGTAEILGDTGKLVPIQDSRALADALKEVLSLNIEDRVDNNKKARLRAEQLFSLESSVEKWLAIYEK